VGWIGPGRRGARLGAGRPKALVELAGRPLVQWSIDALRGARGITQIVVALPPGTQHDLAGVSAVDGGSARSDSVRLALASTREGDPVLVHDAARPLLSSALADAVLDALERDPEADAAIAAVPVKDTIKRVDEGGAVLATLPRSELWAVQTPQVFRRAALERALQAPPHELSRATDDAWLVERSGGKVVVVQASDENLKVTTPLDLELAERLLRARAPRS
jgi:2-C-methyl-D-erythritol 4-phosphate cytidylyltransferase